MDISEENTTEEYTGINTPQVDPKTGKPQRKAISSANQAWEIAKRFEKNNEKRNSLNAAIVDNYNGKNPFDSSKMKATNQGWRSNFSTRFMSSIIDRVTPEIEDFVNRSQTLTHSKLPGSIPGAKDKIESFRSITTRVIREWPGFRDMISLLTKEDVLIGYASLAWLDEDWRPRLYRGDEIFYPDGTGQIPAKVQVVAIKKSFLIHEFAKLIEDREAAELAGYDLENCYKAVNSASSSKDGITNSDDMAREYGDMLREVNNGMSYEGYAETVDVWIVIPVEYDGSCSLWMISQKDGSLIRKVDSAFDSMEDVISMFTVQTGNGRYYGSLGLGRSLVNIHMAIERARCLATDQMYLSGLVLLVVEGKDMNSIQPRVAHPFVYLAAESAKVQQTGITFNHEAFLAIDAKLQNIAEQIAGTYIPRQLEGPGGKNMTATQASIDANREEMVKRGVLNRFWSQFSDAISTMQRKIYSPDNIKEAVRLFKEYQVDQSIAAGGIKGALTFISKKAFDFLKSIGQSTGVFEQPKTPIADSEAVEAIMNLLSAGLTEKEITLLANSPASEMNQESTKQREIANIEWLSNQVGNPMIDQRKSLEYVAATVLGPELAESIVIPDMMEQANDNEAGRLQIMEINSFMAQQPLPVSPRDKHAVHQAIIQDKIGELIVNLTPEMATPELLNSLKIAADHHAAHTQSRLQSGESQQDLANEIAFDKMAYERLIGIEQAIANFDPSMPAQVDGTPIQATGPGGAIEGTPL